MDCRLSEEQLWSWIDRDAPELDRHLEECLECRRRAGRIRGDIKRISTDLAADLPIPEKIGPYEVKRLLGEGGQALVYEAVQENPKRVIALKVLRGGRYAGKRHVQNFLRETRALAKLQHPAIAAIRVLRPTSPHQPELALRFLLRRASTRNALHQLRARLIRTAFMS